MDLQTVSPSGPIMVAVWVLFLAAASYLIGGIPWALLVGRWVGKVDLRTVGSGNLGATNVARFLGGPWAVAVFALDFAKGALPVALAGWLTVSRLDDLAMVAAGAAAVLGHVYSPYIAFRGGKGIATTAGVAGVLNPWCLFWGTVAFFVVAITTRRVSLGSLAIAAIYPPLVVWLYPGRPLNLAFALSISLLIVFNHRANIRRLLKGDEPTASWGMFKTRT